MSTQPDEGNEDTPTDTAETDATDHGRYADLDIADGEVIIYDRTNADAWVQSSFAIGLEFME